MLYVVRKDTHLSSYDSDELSKRYAEQIERGVIVLEKGDSLEIVEEEINEIVILEEEK